MSPNFLENSQNVFFFISNFLSFFLTSQEPKSSTTHPIMALGMPNRYATFINCPKIIQKKKFGIMDFFFGLNSRPLEMFSKTENG